MDIEVGIKITPATLERVDVLARACRRMQGGALAGLERNELLHLAIELGLQQIETQVLPSTSAITTESEITPRSMPAMKPGLRTATLPSHAHDAGLRSVATTVPAGPRPRGR